MPSLWLRHLCAGKCKAAYRVIRKSKVRNGWLWKSPCHFLSAWWWLVICLHVAQFWSFQRDGVSLSLLFLIRSTVDLPPHCSPQSWKSQCLFLCQLKAFHKDLFDMRLSPLGTLACVETSGFHWRMQKPCTQLLSYRKHIVVSHTCSNQYLKKKFEN